jgi:hypothetical protein
MLTHTYSPWTKYLVSHKSDQSLSLDGNFNLWSQDKVRLSLYVNSNLQQVDRKWNNKIQLRTHHDDNKIISIGIEDWDVQSSNKAPEVLSAWGIWGFTADQWRPFIGVGAGLGLQSKSIAYHKYLVGLKQKDWSVYTQLHAQRQHKDGKDSWEQNASIIYDHRINKDLKVSADIKADINDLNKAKFVLVSEYRLDADSFLKARVSNDQTLTLSLTKNFRQLINFCFLTKVSIYFNLDSMLRSY